MSSYIKFTLIKHTYPTKYSNETAKYTQVHGRASGNSGAGAARCGPLMAQGGVQALEAMLFALDAAQRDKLAPPGVRLGALVLDDCDSDTRGLEMALDFIKGEAEPHRVCTPRCGQVKNEECIIGCQIQ